MMKFLGIWAAFLAIVLANNIENMIKDAQAKVENNESFVVLDKTPEKIPDFFKDLDEQSQPKSYEEALDRAMMQPANDRFMTSDERKKIRDFLDEGMQYSQAPKDFLLYFFSTTVPRSSLVNVLHDISILKDNGVYFDTKQYLIGPSANFKEYMLSWKDYLNKLPDSVKRGAIENFHLKLDSSFFKVYEMKKVPVLLYAKCATWTPQVGDCKVKYLIRGDTSLRNFFQQIVLENNEDKDRFLEYVRVLDANKIYKIDAEKIK